MWYVLAYISISSVEIPYQRPVSQRHQTIAQESKVNQFIEKISENYKENYHFEISDALEVAVFAHSPKENKFIFGVPLPSLG